MSGSCIFPGGQLHIRIPKIFKNSIINLKGIVDQY